MNVLTRMRKAVSDERGFTLIEMVFVFVIFAIMAGITLFNFREFNNKAVFNNLADDVALRIVQAQKAAISGSLNANFLGQDVKPTYGVYFSMQTPSASVSAVDADQKHFVYFSDNPIAGAPYNGLIGNKVYDLPSSGVCPVTAALNNECLSVTAITTGEYVSNICYVPTTSTAGTCGSYNLSVAFTRPFPDAALSVRSLASSTVIPATNACVELSSPDTSIAKKTMVITDLGEIRVYGGSATSTADCMGTSTLSP